MTRDDGSTDLLDLHVSQVEEAPRRRVKPGWVLAGALVLVLAVAGGGIAAVASHGPAAPSVGRPSAAAPSTSPAEAPASTTAGSGKQSEGPVIAQAALQRAGLPAGRLTVGTGTLVKGLAPPVVNFNVCGPDWAQMEYLPVEIRNPVGGLAAAVTVQPGPSTPAGIGRLGFFFESGNGDSLPCRAGAAWPTTDTFEAVNGPSVITGYVVLDHAVTPATPQGRPDVFSSLRLKLSNVRQFVDYVPRPLSIGTPTSGELCADDQSAVCAPLG